MNCISNWSNNLRTDFYDFVSEGTPTEGGTREDSAGSTKELWWIWCIVAITPGLAILLLGYLCYRRRRKLGLLQQDGE